MAPKVWLITGANAGFGRAMLDCVLQNGDNVIAAVRRPETLADLPKDRVTVVKMDVTKPEQIDAAFEEIKAKGLRIDVLYNNAGFPNVGEVEAVPLDVCRSLFETNFWGSTTVLRKSLAHMRDVNQPSGGRLLQMASMFGHTVDGCTGYYGATKHAMEALSEALSKELDPAWNIKVVILQPGYFLTDGLKGTGGVSGTQKSYEIHGHPAYTNPTVEGVAIRNAFNTITDPSTIIKGDPAKLSAAVYKAAALENPPLWLPLGKDAYQKIRAKLEKYKKDMDAYESWSADLEF
ncbi:NAD-P-binding protein [Hymenopellis radicata]|nr:NAD-P-binding protein [Hymenopellis radicata]